MHSEAQALRLFVEQEWIAFRVNDSIFRTPKQDFYEALMECEEAVKEGLVQFASLPIPSVEQKLKKPEPKKRRVVRAVNNTPGSRGVKIYLSSDEARWLGIEHGSPVEIIPATIDGESALIIKRAIQK